MFFEKIQKKKIEIIEVIFFIKIHNGRKTQYRIFLLNQEFLVAEPLDEMF
jgi:hypothetical protein